MRHAEREEQRHLDLKNDFYAEVRARGQTPHSEIRLRRQIVKLKELRARTPPSWPSCGPTSSTSSAL
ncbi:hypothetical protein [Streptomyces atratus]|uniref:hypothetical protein n=1 Tax=Streptomyces atratus TaxID=1893 RepID=UPI0033CCC56C